MRSLGNSGFVAEVPLGAPPRGQQHSSVHPTYPDQKALVSGYCKTIRSGEVLRRMAIRLPATQPTGDPRAAWPGSAWPRLHSLGTRRAVSVMKDLGTEFRQYRRSRLCGRFQKGLGYRLLMRGEWLWPGRCNTSLSRPPSGEGRTCPARCDRKASRPGAATTRLALRLAILPPGLAPQRHWTPDGGRSRARAKEPVRDATVEIFPPDWNCPHLPGNDTPALTWDFAYELNAGPSPCTGTAPKSLDTPQPRSRTWSAPRLDEKLPPRGQIGASGRSITYTKKLSELEPPYGIEP
jgi:hypothetical protein